MGFKFSGFVHIVFGDEVDFSVFSLDALECDFAIVNQSNSDLAVFYTVGLFNDYGVSVIDAGVDH